MNNEGGWRGSLSTSTLLSVIWPVVLRPRSQIAAAWASVCWYCRASYAGVPQGALLWCARQGLLPFCRGGHRGEAFPLAALFSSSSLFSRCVTVVREPKRPYVEISVGWRAVRPSQTWREPTVDKDIMRRAVTPWIRFLIWPMARSRVGACLLERWYRWDRPERCVVLVAATPS